MAITTFQIQKRSSYEFRFIQDKIAISELNKVVAISDGTTQSFMSEKWAEILTKEFVVNATFEKDEFVENLKKYAHDFKMTDFEYSSNPAKASLERAKLKKGSTGTFLAIKQESNSTLNCLSFGDSNLFLYNKTDNRILNTFPYSTIDDLDGAQNFLNTEQILNEDFDQVSLIVKQIEIPPNTTIILATDALSRLFISDEYAITQFLLIDSFDLFLKYCLEKWDNKTLQEDDISAVVITDFFESPKNIFPPEGFSFPKEKEELFTPSIPELILEPLSNLNNIQMQNISDNLNRLFDATSKIKRSLSSNTIYLFLIVFLCSVNIFMISFYLFENQDKNIENLKIEVARRDGEIIALKNQIKQHTSTEVDKPAPAPKREADTSKLNKLSQPLKKKVEQDKKADKSKVK